MKPYKDFAIELAQKASKIIRDNFQDSTKREWKADKTPVTKIDLAVNELVLDSVHAAYPGHGILAEERSDMIKGAEYVWVCDPIDGTVPFSHGIPTFGFSLALVKEGVPVLGLATEPISDRVYLAEKGKGAYLDGKRTYVSKQTTGRLLTTVGVFSHSTYDLSYFGKSLVERGMYVFNFGSIVYAGLLVARGESVCATFSGKGAHDVAALKVIVEEAGGKATDLYGNEQRYDQEVKGAIFSNGVLHEELLEVMSKNEILRK